jgi:hypothetical protein
VVLLQTVAQAFHVFHGGEEVAAGRGELLGAGPALVAARAVSEGSARHHQPRRRLVCSLVRYIPLVANAGPAAARAMRQAVMKSFWKVRLMVVPPTDAPIR